MHWSFHRFSEIYGWVDCRQKQLSFWLHENARPVTNYYRSHDSYNNIIYTLLILIIIIIIIIVIVRKQFVFQVRMKHLMFS